MRSIYYPVLSYPCPCNYNKYLLTYDDVYIIMYKQNFIIKTIFINSFLLVMNVNVWSLSYPMNWKTMTVLGLVCP